MTAQSSAPIDLAETAGPPVTLTTAEAADVCSVAPRTIIRWLSRDVLKGHRDEHGTHRVHADSVRALLEQQQREVPAWLQDDHQCVLLISRCEHRLRRQTMLIHQAAPRAQVATATSAFEAGMWLARYSPQVIVVADDVGGIDLDGLCRRTEGPGNQRPQAVVVLQATPDRAKRRALFEAGAALVLKDTLRLRDVHHLVARWLDPEP